MEQDTDLMPHQREVDSLASMYPDDKQVSNDQGGTKILGGQSKAEMHNISFVESHHRVVQAQRVLTPKDQTSPAKSIVLCFLLLLA